MTIEEKIDYSINVIKKAAMLAENATKKPLWLAFSGGKDSQVLYHLAKNAGVDFEAHMNFTSIDPPEVIRFVRENYPDVTTHAPRQSVSSLAVKKHSLPTMRIRWCCEEFKETAGTGYVTLIGVRKNESAKRFKRELVEKVHKNKNKRKQWDYDTLTYHSEVIAECMGNGNEKIVVSPIREWTDNDVWNFLNKIVKVKHCSLYDRGYKRIGCICCPMSGYTQKLKELENYPHVKRNWIKAIKIMQGDGYFKTYKDSAEDFFEWWISGKSHAKWYADKYKQLDFFKTTEK